MKINFKKVITSMQVIIIVGLFMFIGSSSIENVIKSSNSNLNKTLDLVAMSEKVEEVIANDIYAVKDTYTGSLTGYSADCPLCTGYLACNGDYVRGGITTYDDDQYGTVRIVAASKQLPCGSVVKFDMPSVSSMPIYAIVLDRGVGGYALDLLVENESYAYKYVGRKTVNYDILRFGWNKEE